MSLVESADAGAACRLAKSRLSALTLMSTAMETGGPRQGRPAAHWAAAEC